jgi:hypothetical protein
MAQPTQEYRTRRFSAQPSHTGGPHNQPQPTRARRLRPKSNQPHRMPLLLASPCELPSRSLPLSQNLNPRLLEPLAAAVRGAAEQSRLQRRRAAAPVCGVRRVPSSLRPSALRAAPILFFAVCPSSSAAHLHGSPRSGWARARRSSTAHLHGCYVGLW